ncbi:MAG: TIGR03435 family protein [Vicinamibacterales bacterium]
MRPSTAGCAALAAAFKATGARRAPDSPVCGLSRLRGRFRGTRVRLTELVRLLAPAAGRPVVDATGLTGAFDLDLTFTPVDVPDPAVGASLFTAIQEQLGLRLEPRQAPMNRLVIESAERPTPDGPSDGGRGHISWA